MSNLEAQQNLYRELLWRTSKAQWLRAELADSWHAADAVICKTGCLSHGGHWRDADQHCRRKGSRCDHPGAGDVHRTSASLAETVTPGS